MQAFEKDDAAWATEIAARDVEIDRLYQAVYNRLMKIMAHKPEMVTRATYLMWFAHDLERIADRVTNICERVIFLATGEFQEINIRRMHVESGDTEPLDD
jgi:phosphate transport system protein